MKHKLLAIVIVVALVVLTSAMSFAEDAITQITITATVDGLVVPEEIQAGLVTLTFNNQSEAPILPVPSRLKEDVTHEDFLAALQESPDAALGLIAMQGGTMIFPSAEFSVTYDLAVGQYLLIDFAQEVPAFEWFTVTSSSTEQDIEMPSADVEVTLVDFAFHIPLEVEAGEHLWHIANEGGQWHEMVIMQIEEGMTLDDVRAMLLAEPAPEEETSHDHSHDSASEEEGDEEQMPAFLWIPMETGEQAWMTIDLAPGTYAIGCMLPNLNEMGGEEEPHMHAELGML